MIKTGPAVQPQRRLYNRNGKLIWEQSSLNHNEYEVMSEWDVFAEIIDDLNTRLKKLEKKLK